MAQEPPTQKAVRWYPPSYDIRVESVPIPEITEPDDVIVKIKLAGLCGSDLHAYRGDGDDDMTPHIPGHEFIGEVVKLGSSFGEHATGRPGLYSSLKIGDKVVSPFTTNCGECRACRLGITCRCPQGTLFGCPALDGAQAQYVRVPKAGGTLFNLSDPKSWSDLLPNANVAEALSTISDSSLLLLADILPTGVFAVAQALNHPKLVPILTGVAWPPREGSTTANTIPSEDRTLTFAIIGLGPVGICASVALVDRLAAIGLPYRIVAIDTYAARRENMEKIFGQISNHGNGEFVARSPEEARTTVKEWTSGSGCNAVLEVVGHPSALTLAYDLVQPFGIITSVGVHGKPQLPFNGGNLYDKNVSFDFGRCPARAMFPMAFELLVKRQDVFGQVGTPTSLVDRIVSVDQAAEMYRAFDKREVGKVLFDPWE